MAWYTVHDSDPAEIAHLPWQGRECLIAAAWQKTERNSNHQAMHWLRLVMQFIALLSAFSGTSSKNAVWLKWHRPQIGIAGISSFPPTPRRLRR